MNDASKRSFLAVLAATGGLFFFAAGCGALGAGGEPVGEEQASLAYYVDWRTALIITSVRDQGACQGGWAFAVADAISAVHAQATNHLDVLSTRQIMDCWEAGAASCNTGGSSDEAFEYVIKSGGLDSDSDYPYMTSASACKASSLKPAATISSFVDITAKDNDLLKAAVAVRPVVVALETDSPAFQYHTAGVFEASSCGTTPNDYGLLVGYGTEGTTPYWLVKMAWGESWGERGYIRILRQTGQGPGVCGIATHASYPVN